MHLGLRFYFWVYTLSGWPPDLDSWHHNLKSLGLLLCLKLAALLERDQFLLLPQPSMICESHCNFTECSAYYVIPASLIDFTCMPGWSLVLLLPVSRSSYHNHRCSVWNKWIQFKITENVLSHAVIILSLVLGSYLEPTLGQLIVHIADCFRQWLKS